LQRIDKIRIVFIIFVIVIIDLIAEKCNSQSRQHETVKVIMLSSDSITPFVVTRYGYDVRELHNTSEDMNVSGTVECCFNYWKHAYYLDERKLLLSDKIFVWQIADSNWHEKPLMITLNN
jgi:hypothetical protein